MTGDRTPRADNTNAATRAREPALGGPVVSASERDTLLASVEPTQADRARVSQAVALALAAGALSKTALAVDTSMAVRASQVAGTSAVHGIGLKLLASGVVLSGVILGGKVWLDQTHSILATAKATTLASASAHPTAAAPSNSAPATDAARVLPDRIPSESASRPAVRRSQRGSTVVRRKAADARLQVETEAEERKLETEVATEPAIEAAQAQRPAFDLADELWLLREASAALSRHDPTKANQWLSKYAARFGSGALEKEARALAVMVACEQASERAGEERDRFLRAESSSPLSERVRQACAKLP